MAVGGGEGEDGAAEAEGMALRMLMCNCVLSPTRRRRIPTWGRTTRVVLDATTIGGGVVDVNNSTAIKSEKVGYICG
jgi:hypothetical protein